MLIVEVFQETVPVQYSSEREAFEFQIGDVQYSAFFSCDHVHDADDFADKFFDAVNISSKNKQKLEQIFQTPKDICNFEFSAAQQGKPAQTTLTGTGNAFLVIGTIQKILQDYKLRNNDVIVHITAAVSEQSRVKLYKRLASRYENSIGYETNNEYVWLL